jgi:hypothetical protein
LAATQMETTRDRIRQRRLDRMRLGQAVCDYVTLPSDSEIRLCIVPLTEAEYLQVLEKVRDVPARDDLPGMAIRDRTTAQEILVRAIREESDLSIRVYAQVEDMLDDLEVSDIDDVYDAYMEMTARSSPALDGIPDEEFEELKKLLLAMDWSALTGRSWYALKRFLSTITPSPLLDNSPGSTSIRSSTTTSD